MVHGRTGTRVEGIKAQCGPCTWLESLLVSYRNDGVAPAGPDGLYGLGVTEWEDIEVAVQYALDHGAEDVVLFGWSMGSGGAANSRSVPADPSYTRNGAHRPSDRLD